MATGPKLSFIRQTGGARDITIYLFYQLPLIFTALFHVDLILKHCLFHSIYLYQVNMTLHFLNEVDDAELMQRSSIILNRLLEEITDR